MLDKFKKWTKAPHLVSRSLLSSHLTNGRLILRIVGAKCDGNDVTYICRDNKGAVYLVKQGNVGLKRKFQHI